MVSRKTYRGKHPLTVRVDEETYSKIKACAYDEDITPTQWIVKEVEKSLRRRERKSGKE